MPPEGQQGGDSNWYNILRNSLGRISRKNQQEDQLALSFSLRCQKCGVKFYLFLSQLQILALAEPLASIVFLFLHKILVQLIHTIDQSYHQIHYLVV